MVNLKQRAKSRPAITIYGYITKVQVHWSRLSDEVIGTGEEVRAREKARVGESVRPERKHGLERVRAREKIWTRERERESAKHSGAGGNRK